MSARWVCVLALVGCGGRVDVERSDAAPDGTLDADAIVDEGYCPTLEPVDGTPCEDRLGHSCTYGDRVLPGCRRRYWCGTSLELRWHQLGRDCVEPRDCPATRPTNGTPCSLADGWLGCAFPDASLCFCIADDGGASWTCVTPEPSCPGNVPNEGTPCVGDQKCSYGYSYNRWCVAGARVWCSADHWNWDIGCTSDK